MRRKLVNCIPHKNELKDEHFYMAGAYGVGAFMTHTLYGMMFVSIAYFIVFVIQVHDMRKGS